MANIFIIHGSYGYPEENWFPWLKEELIKLGHQVIVPEFPTPDGQELAIWLDVFKKHIPLLNSETILIGHSCGGAFLLSLLEKIDVTVKATLLIASPAKPTLNQFDEVHLSFVDKEFDWKRIKNHCKQFFIYHAHNDPYVPFEHAEVLSKNLSTNIIEIENAGHFNANAGYTKFEILLEQIKEIL